jgi:hypothetical protein
VLEYVLNGACHARTQEGYGSSSYRTWGLSRARGRGVGGGAPSGDAVLATLCTGTFVAIDCFSMVRGNA